MFGGGVRSRRRARWPDATIDRSSASSSGTPRRAPAASTARRAAAGWRSPNRRTANSAISTSTMSSSVCAMRRACSSCARASSGSPDSMWMSTRSTTACTLSFHRPLASAILLASSGSVSLTIELAAQQEVGLRRHVGVEVPDDPAHEIDRARSRRARQRAAVGPRSGGAARSSWRGVAPRRAGVRQCTTSTRSRRCVVISPSRSNSASAAAPTQRRDHVELDGLGEGDDVEGGVDRRLGTGQVSVDTPRQFARHEGRTDPPPATADRPEPAGIQAGIHDRSEQPGHAARPPPQELRRGDGDRAIEQPAGDGRHIGPFEGCESNRREDAIVSEAADRRREPGAVDRRGDDGDRTTDQRLQDGLGGSVRRAGGRRRSRAR